MKPNVRYYKILAIIRLSKDSQQRIYRGAIISSKVELSRAYLRSNPGRELLMVRFLLKFDGPSWDVDRELLLEVSTDAGRFTFEDRCLVQQKGQKYIGDKTRC